MTFWKLRHQEHENGWTVLLDGERIAELDYLHDDQPFHRFRARLLSTDTDKIHFALRHTAVREPSERVVFRNRLADVAVADRYFFTNLHDDGTVGIRDVRPGPPGDFLTVTTWQACSHSRCSIYTCLLVAAVAAGVIVVRFGLPPDWFVWISMIGALACIGVKGLLYAAILKYRDKKAGALIIESSDQPSVSR